jgi:hypothetical protein
LEDLADYVCSDGYSTDVDAFSMDVGLPQIESLLRDGKIHQYMLLNSTISNQKPVDKKNYCRIDLLVYMLVASSGYYSFTNANF